MNPKISIILPIYNVAEYLEEALDSILDQTIGYENLEVIMVNDGSSDQSGKIIDEYEKKYTNFKAIHLKEKSGSAGKPRNVGMKNSTSEYLMFLDPDDYYMKTACETLYNTIVSEDIDFVFCKYIIDYGNSKKHLHTIFDAFDRVKAQNIENNPDFLRIPPSVWCKIYKRKFIEDNNIKFNEGVAGQDLVFVAHAFLKANGIIFLNKELVNYRIRNENNKSLSFQRNKKYIFGLLESYKLMCNIYKQNHNEHLLSIILEHHLSNWMNQFIVSDLSDSEKREAFIASKSLFKEYNKFKHNPQREHIEHLFSNIINEDYERAISFTNAIHDLVENQERMENEIIKISGLLHDKNSFGNELKKKTNEISELKTVKGYMKYKINNIYSRSKNRLINRNSK